MAKPKSPIIIEGIPANRSIAKSIIDLIGLETVYSARKIPAEMPKGTARIQEKKTRSAVPTTAGHIPSQTGALPNNASYGETSPKNRERFMVVNPWLTRNPTKITKVVTVKIAQA
jgi:hypothetical protein